ncbi:MAG: hypothetical protein K9G76_06725 [Bacteroidales bacterium]|nr:hypothetical protein [Bacteroidales bacterium]MCF8404329.1 hypothetical protein [Bacteroidales bacterium]
MKKIIFLFSIFSLPMLIFAQEATIRITNINVEISGEKVDWNQSFTEKLSDDSPKTIILFEQDGIKYGTTFTYRKGANRIKLARKGFATLNGGEVKNARKRKDMQELRTSITGSFSKRVVDNIVLNKQELVSIQISYNYELIYK